MISEVKNLFSNARRGEKFADVYSLEKGRVYYDKKLYLRIHDGEVAVVRRNTPRIMHHPYSKVTFDNYNPVGPVLSQRDIISVLSGIDSLAYTPSTYGDARTDKALRQLYSYKQRSLKYMDKFAEVDGALEDTLPCAGCGIILPERLITVDHQRPQAGGEEESIAKVFRAFGLTKGGPAGGKGQQIRAQLLALNAGKPYLKIDKLVDDVVDDRTTLNAISLPQVKAPNLGMDDRYTTNDAGNVILSVIYSADAEDILKTKCMHSVVNLRPLCHHCNSSRGNPLKY